MTETQDEIEKIKRRYNIVRHQISRLKEEIDAKDGTRDKYIQFALNLSKSYYVEYFDN